AGELRARQVRELPQLAGEARQVKSSAAREIVKRARAIEFQERRAATCAVDRDTAFGVMAGEIEHEGIFPFDRASLGFAHQAFSFQVAGPAKLSVAGCAGKLEVELARSDLRAFANSQ